MTFWSWHLTAISNDVTVNQPYEFIQQKADTQWTVKRQRACATPLSGTSDLSGPREWGAGVMTNTQGSRAEGLCSCSYSVSFFSVCFSPLSFLPFPLFFRVRGFGRDWTQPCNLNICCNWAYSKLCPLLQFSFLSSLAVTLSSSTCILSF